MFSGGRKKVHWEQIGLRNNNSSRNVFRTFSDIYDAAFFANIAEMEVFPKTFNVRGDKTALWNFGNLDVKKGDC